ncbi:hypothetical protein RFI_06141, partial [Reticulomyxa filosa]
DLSAMAILQKYPKHETDIQSLTNTARKIQQGLIKLEFDKELHTQLASEEVCDLVKEANKMFRHIDQKSSPSWQNENNQIIETRKTTLEELISDSNPGIRVPGYCHLTPQDKAHIQEILFYAYRYSMPSQHPMRMGYLVKRGSGKQGFFSRQSLKLRWFVIENQTLAYYKNFKAYQNKEDPLRLPITLKGRAVRVVNKDLLCFEISGVQLSCLLFYFLVTNKINQKRSIIEWNRISKRAYLLFAETFQDFVLWLHALTFCADKKLNELM